jgi:hypothetical protein
MDIRISVKKRYLILMLLLAFVGGGGFYTYANKTNANPLPDNLKNQISFKIIYPENTGHIDESSFLYKTESKVLSFSVKKEDKKIVFTEQTAPENVGDGNQVSFQAIGLHPYANFQSKLGPVALAKFWESKNLDPYGQSAFLVSNGTLLNAHSDKDLTNAEWKDLINSLKVSQ